MGRLRSIVPGIVWPAIVDASTASLLSLVWQLEQSQWWSASAIAEAQAEQLALLVAHARATVPFYASERGVITREDVIAAGDALVSRGYPAAHGPVSDTFTSRTSGEPVRVKAGAVITTLWHALTLREHLWHERDLHAKLAAIRYTGDDAREGLELRGWGPATIPLAPDAPMSVLSIAAPTARQYDWLRREDPAYLLVYPMVLAALLDRFAADGARLPSLRQVRTISEVLDPSLRARCREVLGVRLVDTYSAQEVGYIAFECPERAGTYHVQAERVIVEIVDEAGAACPIGAVGRVVVTDLHNFATPLLRYDLGDYAEVVAPCPCGRGLPSLGRIWGRRRNLLTLPGGTTIWPVFTVACRRAARYREIQLVQETVDRLRVRVVPDGPLDRDALVRAIHELWQHPFEVEVEEVASLARSPAGKLEEFVSLIRGAAPPR
jgi:phenylacetate-CoA ligase